MSTMIRHIAAVFISLAVVTPVLAQAPATAPAAPFTPPSSTLSSLFGKYTMKGDFGVKEPKE